MTSRLHEIKELRDSVLSETSGRIYPVNSFQQDFPSNAPSRLVIQIQDIGDKSKAKKVSPKDMDELKGIFPKWETFAEVIHTKFVNDQNWALVASRLKKSREMYVRLMKSGSVSDLLILIKNLADVDKAMANRTPSAFGK